MGSRPQVDVGLHEAHCRHARVLQHNATATISTFDSRRNRRAASPQNVRYFRSLNPPTYTQMLYHWKVLHIPVTIRPVVELPSGAVSVNPRSNKVTMKRLILEIGRFWKLLDIKMAK